jgi:hypothetical protein
VIRRRLAVTAVVLTALAGEWLGHGLAYYRMAGVAGLQAGLGSGVHDFMLPLAAALLVAAAGGAAWFTRSWLALGRRIDASTQAVRRIRAGERPAPPAGRSHADRAAAFEVNTLSPVARLLATAVPLALVQCVLYLVQENLERVIHGMPAAGLAPLLDAAGAAAWIQLAVAAVMGAVLTVALSLLRSRQRAAGRGEGLVRALLQRLRRLPLTAPPATTDHVTPARLLLGSALWQRPPPALSPA